MSSVIITPEQPKEYQDRVADNDGNDVDVEDHYWVGYCYCFRTGGVEIDTSEAHRIWRQTLLNMKNLDGLFLLNLSGEECSQVLRGCQSVSLT
jgi:hypothetical protein